MLYTWSPANGLSTTSGAGTTASPQTTTTYVATVTNENGCRNKDSVMITVNPRPVFTAVASQPVLCLGDTITLEASGGDRYTWSPAGTLGNVNSPVTMAYPAATTRYKVVIENDECSLRDSLFVNVPVVNKPSVKTTKSNDINCIVGQATLQTGGGSRYLWQPATGLSDPTSSRPVARINQTTTYRVTVTTNQGCVVEDSITVHFFKGDDGSGFPVPSAFTPNGDGRNDCFGVNYWGDVQDFSMNLYNRWGEVVFHANDPSQCWNGVHKGKLQPGDVYVFLIKAKTRCGDVFRKGTFTLVR
jgi:gliding motility-associated-like protein